MKKLLLTSALTVLMGASVAMAIPSSGTIVGHQGSQSYGQGGLFNVTANGTTSFQTFCIEDGYQFAPGVTYDYTLGQTTHGAPPAGAATVLLKGTAYLFSQWSTGVYGVVTALQAGEIQAALWYLQGMGNNLSAANGLNGGAGNSYYDAAVTALGGTLLDPSAGAYGIQVIQLTSLDGKPAQDWLVNMPDGGTTIILLGLGLIAVGFFYRRSVVA